MTEIYPLPPFLEGKVEPADYRKWLHRKALSHVQRDRLRGNTSITNEIYKQAIHAAILASAGKDAYTGEDLDWSLIGTYDNEMAAKEGRNYRVLFKLLPTLDHVDDGLGAPNFKICGQRTNDCKSLLSHDEFVDFCRAVIAHYEAAKAEQGAAANP